MVISSVLIYSLAANLIVSTVNDWAVRVFLK